MARTFHLCLVSLIILSASRCDKLNPFTDFRDDNKLDKDGKNYQQNHYELVVGPESVEIVTENEQQRRVITGYLAQTEIWQNREKIYNFWTIDTNQLALKYDDKIVGNPNALNILYIKQINLRGWLFTGDSIEKNKLILKWWDQPDSLWLADFQIYGSRRNLLGGWIGAWNRYPGDPNQGAIETDALQLGYNGKNCMRLDYDVESVNPAVCGIFFKLHPDTNGTINLSKYKYLSIYLRGDNEKGFSQKFQIELKGIEPPDFYSDWTKQEKIRLKIHDLESVWKHYICALDEFVEWPPHANLKSLDAVHELTITFTDKDVDPDAKVGAIYIDDICFLDSLPYQGADSIIVVRRF